ncbi:septation protein SepH [Tessaracoccus sp. HF-7]|nr:septation protein SepH [Tessaracoccus caeni]
MVPRTDRFGRNTGRGASFHMESALSPREIQARIRGGATLDEVAAEAGVDAQRIAAFAGPVMAEREHMTRQALGATVRRRGESGTHRRLGQLIGERLLARGIDADEISWDASRRADLKWRIVGVLSSEKGDAESRTAEFVYDPRGRFNVADNADARWMIGEELTGSRTPDEENTVDLRDELALVRAVTAPEPKPAADLPGDDIPAAAVLYEPNEDTSQLDELYDLLSGISEDSVRIYTDIDRELPARQPEVEPGAEATAPGEPEATVAEPEPDAAPQAPEQEQPVDQEPSEPEQDAAQPEKAEPTSEASPEPTPSAESTPEPPQEALIDGPATSAPKSSKRRRAQIPSWDEIMFGAPRAPKKD